MKNSTIEYYSMWQQARSKKMLILIDNNYWQSTSVNIVQQLLQLHYYASLGLNFSHTFYVSSEFSPRMIYKRVSNFCLRRSEQFWSIWKTSRTQLNSLLTDTMTRLIHAFWSVPNSDAIVTDGFHYTTRYKKHKIRQSNDISNFLLFVLTRMWQRNVILLRVEFYFKI